MLLYPYAFKKYVTRFSVPLLLKTLSLNPLFLILGKLYLIRKKGCRAMVAI